ncbi:hypothetical protein ACFRAA_30300 [[Kitasatospora] papulosa]
MAPRPEDPMRTNFITAITAITAASLLASLAVCGDPSYTVRLDPRPGR